MLFLILQPVLMPHRTRDHEKLKAQEGKHVARVLGKCSLLYSCKSKGLTSKKMQTLQHGHD